MLVRSLLWLRIDMLNAPLRRDPETVRAACIERGGQILTTSPCVLQIPTRFAELGLASIEETTFVYGVYALIVGDTYAVSNINAMVELGAARVQTVTINGSSYYAFEFEANQPLLKTTVVLKRDLLIFNILEELIIKGKVPWYLTYADLGRLFDTAKRYSGSNVGEMAEVVELIVSIISRQPNDKTMYYRTAVKTLEDLKSKPPAYIPMNSVFYAATNTLSKLAGAYFNDGVVSALTTSTDTIERLESILRA